MDDHEIAYSDILTPYLYLDTRDGENHFIFMYCTVSSYLCYGKYYIEDDRLILNTSDGPNTYVFKIETDALVFMADESTALPDIQKSPIASDGDRFELSAEE